MNDKPIPKYQIREKTPEEQLDEISDAKLLKKIKEERIKLNKEKIEWENVINKVKGYKGKLSICNRKKIK
ncbi:unnamed protein product [marine sediment metagenome]|uniref:Uncharacterized protein n=1 Tax=marine sediment metagenome TaxID=412755 RepID=X0Z008_9ZZZZ